MITVRVSVRVVVSVGVSGGVSWVHVLAQLSVIRCRHLAHPYKLIFEILQFRGRYCRKCRPVFNLQDELLGHGSTVKTRSLSPV